MPLCLFQEPGLFRLRGLLILLQHGVNPRGVPFRYAVNHTPDSQIAQNENDRKHQNGRNTPFQPSIYQIGGKIAQI